MSTMTHQAWPYPRSTEQILHVIMVFTACLILSAIGSAVLIDHYKHKVLNRDNIEQAATALQSYASEAAMLTDQSIHSRTPQNYQETYITQLQDQTDQIIIFLESHQTPSAVRPKTDTILVESHLLAKNLANIGGNTNHADLAKAHRSFVASREAFKSVENSL